MTRFANPCDDIALRNSVEHCVGVRISGISTSKIKVNRIPTDAHRWTETRLDNVQVAVKVSTMVSVRSHLVQLLQLP